MTFRNLETTFDRFASLKVSLLENPAVQVRGNAAWVMSLEHAELQPKTGDKSVIDNIATNVFERIDGRWVMVSHQAQVIPK